MTDRTNLMEVTRWHQGSDGTVLPEPVDGWEWPEPPFHVASIVTGSMREAVLERIGREPGDQAGVRLVEIRTEGGYSEYTVEIDYELEVWVDEAGQAQRVFHHDCSWDSDVLPHFFAWLEGGDR